MLAPTFPRRVSAWATAAVVPGPLVLLGSLLWCWSGPLADQLRAESVPQAVSYDRDIRPLLAEYCFACHGFDAQARQADLRLDTRQGALESGSGDALVPGDASASQLIQRIESEDHDLRMPPPESGKSLSNAQKLALRRWIEQGAEYEEHWAFAAPRQSPPPEVASESRSPGSGLVQHPIDRFIQAQLAEADLAASPAASAETQLRRLSLDLIGLPPTPAELDSFTSLWKQDPELAYHTAVDRLLASPHYGERFGRWWLDQARYADSNGYSIDAPREIWLYRDWVIAALNADMPFDQFTIEQLAGDLLPGATDAQRIATGFHRNTQINQEGGIDKEQFRLESVFDRVATTGTVWLGLTIGCAQCHDHKFDPISQQDYYQLMAFFNNQDEPTLKVELSDGPTVSTMVLQERDAPRTTHRLVQGDFTRPAELVQAATPSILPPLQCEGTTPNRLDLARWLVDGRNPLTARVVVNRLWQHFFGRGLVESDSDFGLQGSVPSHPELLDWLAVEFVEGGWKIKSLVRQIVSSHTYRQCSKIRPELEARDPNNLLLGRQTRLRLEAELVRDVALVASEMLEARIGGPPVFPPIPDGVMSLGQVKHAWKTSQGADRYRRGMYTFVFRATPPPALNVFDAPDGYSSCTRRIRSNTPLQALTLLNDTGYFELAQALERLIASQGLAECFRRCTSRYPDTTELDALSRLDTLTAARVMLNLDETITRE